MIKSAVPLTWALVCLMICAGCGGAQREDRSANEPVMKELEGKIGLTFPPGSELLNFSRDEGWLDDALLVKMRIPHEATDALVKSIPSDCRLQSEFNLLNGSGPKDWWKAGSARRFLSGSFTLPNAQGCVILLDLDDATWTVVYVDWHRT